MAKSKNTDIICIAVIVFTVVLTLLFMFGESLGLSVMADSESSGDMFRAVIEGVDDAWEVSLLCFMIEMIQQSHEINIFDFKRRGLL